VPFGHRLEQTALRLRGSPVDLVGQDHVGEDGSGFEFEFAPVLIKDRNAHDVGRQQVARELNALKTAIQTARDGVRQRRLAHAGNVLDEQMPPCQQGHNRQAYRLRFAADDALDGLLKLAQAMSSGGDQTSLTSGVDKTMGEGDGVALP
jgi:hypothetical protein